MKPAPGACRRPWPTVLDAKDLEATFPPIGPLRPSTEAPSVLIVLIDDAGFATPTAERLGHGGARPVKGAPRLAGRIRTRFTW